MVIKKYGYMWGDLIQKRKLQAMRIVSKKKESWNLFAGCRENLFFLHLTKTIDQNEQREPAIPYFCFLKNGREATKIHEKLVNAVGEQALTLSTVRRWIAKFKGDETDIQDNLVLGGLAKQCQKTQRTCK